MLSARYYARLMAHTFEPYFTCLRIKLAYLEIDRLQLLRKTLLSAIWTFQRNGARCSSLNQLTRLIDFSKTKQDRELWCLTIESILGISKSSTKNDYLLPKDLTFTSKMAFNLSFLTSTHSCYVSRVFPSLQKISTWVAAVFYCQLP